MNRLPQLRRGLPLLACSAIVVPSLGCFHGVTPPRTILVDSTATIQGKDGSFRIDGGRAIPTPFTTAHGFMLRPGSGVLEAWKRALEHGARRVRVAANGRVRHGLLALLPVSRKAAIGMRRIHHIRVPERYLLLASNGRVSVVYEPYSDGAGRYVAWALWLSDQPF